MLPVEMINNITFKPTAERSLRYFASCQNFGFWSSGRLFVPGNEVLLHISEVSWDRIDKGDR